MISFYHPTFCQNNDSAYTFYRFKSDKEVKLRSGREIRVNLYTKVDSINNITTERYVYGRLVSKNNSNLTIDAVKDVTTITREDRIEENIIFGKIRHHSSFHKVLEIENIDFIVYEPKVTPILRTGTIISMVTLFVIAPAVSYNYSNGTFNGERYLKILKPSLLESYVIPTVFIAVETRRLKIRSQ